MSIEIRNVNKHFGSFHALRNVNLDIDSGELLALLTADGRHQRVLDEGLQRLGRWLEQS